MVAAPWRLIETSARSPSWLGSAAAILSQSRFGSTRQRRGQRFAEALKAEQIMVQIYFYSFYV
jgi:hypothetical protein